MADAQVVCVEPALKYPNVSLLTNALVIRLETSSSGREVTKVHVERNGAVETYQGDIVAMSCGAVNSAALLLRSADDRHPNDLVNSSDVVGRHYMCHHNNSVLLAISKQPNPTVFQKTIGLNDFYHRSEDWDYPLGHISMVGKQDLESFRTGAPAFAPGLALDFIARHSLDFWMTSEELPAPDNRVLVDRQAPSRCTTPKTISKATAGGAKLKDMLGHIGCERHLVPHHLYLGKKIPIAGTAHQCGTVCFGKEIRTRYQLQGA